MFDRDNLAEVRSEAVVAATPAWVLDALTGPQLMQRWFADGAEFTARHAARCG